MTVREGREGTREKGKRRGLSERSDRWLAFGEGPIKRKRTKIEVG